jgi:hypothetical protein
MGGCPQEWRTEVTQLSTVSNRLKGRRTGHHMPSYGGVSVELRPHKQRETVPIGLVELSPYRVNLGGEAVDRSVRDRKTGVDHAERSEQVGPEIAVEGSAEQDIHRPGADVSGKPVVP